MALGNHLGEPLKSGECRSVYVGGDDRFVVSFASSYSDIASTPEQAAAFAIDLAMRDDTVWFVHDRETGDTYAMETKQFAWGGK